LAILLINSQVITRVGVGNDVSVHGLIDVCRVDAGYVFGFGKVEIHGSGGGVLGIGLGGDENY